MSEEAAPVEPRVDAALADARFVVGQIVRGEVLSGPALEQAQPLVHQVLIALEAFDTSAPPAPDRNAALQSALAALMAALSPITMQSLKDTEIRDSADGIFRRLVTMWTSARAASAFRFSARLVVFTVVMMAVAVICSVAADTTVKTILGPRLKVLLELLEPYAYGAVGACVYLLRALHKHIYGRTFDRRRKPEYVNRVLLGMVSGGIIGLFLGVKADAGEGTKIGSAALGFLAGYNIDLLFSALERVTSVIFPKTETPPQPTPSAIAAAEATPPPVEAQAASPPQ